MKSTRIKTFIFIIYFSALFFNNISQIKAAEAPGDNSSENLSKDHATPKTDEDDPFTDIVNSFATNSYERDLFAELIVEELSVYVSLLLKLFALVNSADAEHPILAMRQFFVSFVLNSSFERRASMVSKQVIAALTHFLNAPSDELRLSLLQNMHDNSVKLFDTAINHKDGIKERINSLLNMLSCLIDLGIERTLVSSAYALFSFFYEYELVLSDFSAIFSNSPRKDILYRFIFTKGFIGNIDFSFCYSRVDSNLLEEKVDKSARDQVTSQIINSSSLDIEELCKMKEIMLTALDLLKAALYIIFVFDRTTFSTFLTHIREIEEKIKEQLNKINCDGLTEQKYLELKIIARDLFGIDGVQTNNFVSECFENCLTKEAILTDIMSVYKTLLNSILVLNNFGPTFLRVDFFKSLFESVLKLFEDYTKKSAKQIKVVKSYSEDKIKNLQLSTNREKFRQRKELYLKSLQLQAETEKKESKERRRSEKKKKEEKERLEKERLSQEIKNTEKKSRKKKHKPRREFPILEVSAADISKEDVGEAQTSTSSSTSQEISSEAIQQTCKTKINRKEQKLNKLLREEQKSLQREEVKKTIQEQKLSASSLKKRRQDERKIRNENRREREEKERLEEKEREMEENKKKQERMDYNNYMYTLLNSISSIEGLFAEAEKSRAGISSLISLVFQIVSEEKVETEEASSEEGISDMLASLSVSDTVTPQQQASGLSRTGMELGARPKTRVGGPKPRSSSSSSS
ncbi:putative Secreted Protein, partial [Cryptosporidium tyzzeri]